MPPEKQTKLIAVGQIGNPSYVLSSTCYSAGHSQAVNSYFSSGASSVPLRKPIQDADATLEDPVFGCATDAEMGITAAENVAGNNEQVVANCFSDKFTSCAPGGFGKHVKSATWFDDFKMIF